MNLVKNNDYNKFPQGGLLSRENAGQAADLDLGIAIKEFSDGVNHKTVIELTDYVVGPLAAAAAALTLVPPQALYTIPAGAQLAEVAYAYVGLDAAGTAVDVDLGLGLTIGDGSANATLGAAGAGMEDVLGGFTVDDTVTNALVEGSNITPSLLGIASDKAVYLNAAGTWNVDNTGNLTATGTIILIWKTIS